MKTILSLSLSVLYLMDISSKQSLSLIPLLLVLNLQSRKKTLKLKTSVLEGQKGRGQSLI